MTNSGTGGYVAMGSSFAAGPGLRPRAAGSPRRAGRSSANYAHRLAARLGLELHDVSYSGATVRQLLEGSPVQPPQLDAVDSTTSLVTVTGGGNDVGYLPALTLASLPAPLRALLGGRRRLDDLLDPDATHARFRSLEGDLAELVARIRQAAPDARVVIVGYLTILPNAAGSAGELSPAVHRWGLDVASRLADTMSRVAAATGAEFLDAGEASVDHHAWAAEPWTRRFHYSLRGGAPYHPNDRGMQELARLLAERIAG